VNAWETLALVNYGHFTAMVVHPGGVRGLTYHLERLDRDAKVLFGHGIDGAEVRSRVHEALAGHELPATARVTVFARDLPFDHMDDLPRPEFLVKIRPFRRSRPQGIRVRSSVYTRDLPEVKHIGTFGLFHQTRLAQQAGYDDALFVDAEGRIGEGSVWNVGFYDGERIVWPSGPALPGVEMRLQQDGLRRMGIPYETREVRLPEISVFRSAFLTNAINDATLIASIDDVKFAPDPDLAELLRAAHDSNPLEPLVTSDTQAQPAKDLR
jgi:4-amino-4-deoxychorismate lyase